MRPMGVITCAAPMNTSSNVTYTHKKFKRAPIEASEALDHQHPHHLQREVPSGPIKTSPLCVETALTPSNGLLATPPVSIPAAATSPAAPEVEEARRRNGRGGKYKCEYCGMGCAKPSVLDKHKRTHTNERPYSCNQCSTAFKTKSNYLKHTRSRSHAQRRDGPEGSDGAAESGDNGDGDEGTRYPAVKQCLPMDISLGRHSDPASSSMANQGPPEASRDHGGTLYKPRFRGRPPHSTEDEEASPPRAEHQTTPPNDTPDGHVAITSTYHAPASTLSHPGAHPALPGLPRHCRLPQEICTVPRKEDVGITGPSSSSPSLKSVTRWKGIEPPSPEVVGQHINKLIVENEAIIETHTLWPRRYKRQPSLGSSSSESESSGSGSSRRGSLADPGTKSSKGSAPAPTLQGQLRERSHSHTSETVLAESRCSYSPRLPPTATTLHLPLAQPMASASKPSISLPGLTTSYSQSPPPLLESGLYDPSRKRCLSEGRSTPRDLTKVRLARSLEDQAEVRRQHYPRNSEGSVIKTVLLGPQASVDQRGRFVPHTETGSFPCTRCRILCRTLEELDIHMHFCGQRPGLGSDRGTPDLIKNGESGRWVGEQDVALDLHVKPDSMDPERCSSRSSCGLEDLSQEAAHTQQQSPKVHRSRSAPEGTSPPVKKRKHSAPDERSLAFTSKCLDGSKMNNHQLFGGEVQICDGHERKTMRIDPGQQASPAMEICIPPQQLGGGGLAKAETSVPTSVVVTIAKSSLNSGGTMVQVDSQLGTTTKTTPSLVTSAVLHKEQSTPTITKVVHPSTLYPAEGGQFPSFPYFPEFAPHLQLPNLVIPGIPTPDLGSLSFTNYSPRVPNPNLHGKTTVAHTVPTNHKQNIVRSPADRPRASPTPPFPGAQGYTSSGVMHSGVGRVPVPEIESNLSQSRDKEKDALMAKGLPRQGFPTLIPFGDTKVPHVPGIPGPYSQSSPVCPLPNGGPRRQPAVFTLPSQTSVTFSTPITSVPVSCTRETNLAVPRPRESPRSPGRERGSVGGSTIRLPQHLPHKELLSPRATPSLASSRLLDLKPINQETKLYSGSPAPETKISERTTASPEPQQPDTPSTSDVSDQEFLPPRKRPNFLALKPQPFTPKSSLALMGTTLVSPDTPRPKKSCVQMFLNGSAYTYLGHKVSTKTYYCCIYRQQPMYAPQGPNSKLSMYSNWQIKPEDPLKMMPCPAMSLYQSYKRDHTYTVAQPKELDLIQTHSSYWTFKQKKEKHKEEESKPGDKDVPEIKIEEAISTKALEASLEEGTSVVIKREAEDNSADCLGRSSDDSEGAESIASNKRIKIFEGGFKSTEDYTYVRGRGRGRYVCGTCGIRCKKPSMLRKHCRTHTDLRPYACSHCSFSFKTKGNLTKHLRSKAHYKRCVEMGVVPVPTVVDESHVNEAALAWQDKLEQERKPDSLDGEDDDEDDDDDEEEDVDDEDDEDEDESGMEGHQFQDAHEHLSQRMATLGTSLGTLGTSLSSLGTTITRSGDMVGIPGLPSSRSGVLVMQHTPTPSLSSFTCSTSTSNSSSSSICSSTSTTNTTTITPIVSVMSSSSSLSSPPSSSLSPSSKSPPSRGDSRDCPMDLSVRRGVGGGGGGGAADKGAPHRPSFLPGLSRSAVLDSPGLVSPSTPIREHPSEILSPVTESSSLLKSIYQTTERAAQVSTVLLDPSSENGSSRSMLHAYLRERAVLDTAIKRQQYSFSDTSPGSPHLPPGDPQAQEKGTAAPQDSKDRGKISPPSSSLSIASNNTSTFTTTSTISNSAIIVTSSQVSSSPSSSASRMPTPPANLTVMNSGGGLDTKTAFLVPSGVVPSSLNRLTSDEGKCKCSFCHKEFNRPVQLSLHMNIHYMERPFRCDSCAVSFRTNGHLQKHKRSVSHFNKVNMNMTFGTPSTDNPRPFKCHDCKIAFRIHGHLAKHLRSKMHIMKLECLGKLPFGTYAEIERSGANLNEIDTADCDNALESLQAMASRLYEKDPTKLATWKTQQGREHHRVRTISNSSTNSDDYPLQDDQDDPMAGCGHDEDTEGDDDEEMGGPRDGAGRGSLPGVVVGEGDIHTQALSSMEMGLSPPASLLTCNLCHEKFLEPEHLTTHLYSVHKVSATYRNS